MGDGVLAKMYTQTFTMDVVIKVEGDEREINAHRYVLIGASDYFHSLFKDNFQEKDSKEIILKEICFDTLQMLVEFVYTGKLNLKNSTARKALELADYLMIDCAIKSLNEHISNSISLENCFEYYGAFEVLSGEVRDKLETFIRKNLNELNKRKDFLAMTMDQLKCILSNPSPIPNLSDINGIILWTNTNEGFKYLPQLLPLVVYTVKPIVGQLFTYLMPICKCADSKDYFIALLAKTTGNDNEFTKRFFNGKNWKI